MVKVLIGNGMTVHKNGYFLGWISHGWLEHERRTIWRVNPVGSAGLEWAKSGIYPEVLDFSTQKDAFEYLIGERIEFVSNG